MTSVLHRASAQAPAWSSMPGWSIVADLTPPELRARRSLGTLRRAIGAGLVLVVVLCIVGYFSAGRSQNSAQSNLDAANAQSVMIQSEIGKHSKVTSIEAATTAIRSQLSTLMASDVDVSNFIEVLMANLPPGMTITSVGVELTPGQATTDTSASSATAGVGTVTLAGKSTDLTDLAEYASALNGKPGIIGVLPTSNSAGPDGGAWTLSLDITAKRYTNRFGSPSAATSTSSTATTPTTTTGGN